MRQKVPYLREEHIEREAAALLAEFQQARGVVITRRVPIEDIIEKHLKLGIEFDDLHQRFRVPRSAPGIDTDILGAIYFDARRIVVDQSLDPVEHPSKEGRYRFTLAHEGGGHWRLHRHLFASNPAQISLFSGSATPSVLCRSSQAKEPVEWQADFYASCLLMPRRLIMSAWDEMFPDRRPRVIQPTVPVGHPFVEIPRSDSDLADWDSPETDENILDRFAKPLAEQFLVSPIAMRIRLEKLGLLHRKVPHQWFLTNNA